MDPHAPQERFLDDFPVGFRFATGTHTLTEPEMIAFAERYDPQPFHTDPRAARETFFGGLVAGGYLTAALVWTLVVRSRVFAACALAGVGMDRLRWRLPVRAGDTVRVTGEVIANRVSESRPDRGVLTVAHEMLNQREECVLTCEIASLLARRPTGARA